MKIALRTICSTSSMLVLFSLSSAIAHAGTVSGTAFCDITANTGGTGSGYAANVPTISQLANAESTSAGQCATFTASAINFNSGGVYGNPGTSLNSFLNSGGSLLSSSYMDVGASANGAQTVLANGAQDSDGTLLVLTGTDYLTNGETITLSHDDGAYIYLSTTGLPGSYSLIAGEPSNSGAQTVAGQSPFTFTGTTGAYNFELIYASNYLQPAALISNINTGTAPSPTPEPGSFVLLGSGLMAAAGMIRRRVTA